MTKIRKYYKGKLTKRYKEYQQILEMAVVCSVLSVIADRIHEVFNKLADGTLKQ